MVLVYVYRVSIKDVLRTKTSLLSLAVALYNCHLTIIICVVIRFLYSLQYFLYSDIATFLVSSLDVETCFCILKLFRHKFFEVLLH